MQKGGSSCFVMTFKYLYNVVQMGDFTFSSGDIYS